MDEKVLRPGENNNQGSYIWLRYSTQFTTGGRTHTIEMGVPMPLGASMPLAPVSTGTTGNIPLREFLQYIKENFDLDPKQAMNLLKVKSLNDINRREALEHLQHLVLQEGKSPSSGAPAEPARPANTPPSRPASDDDSTFSAPSGPTPIIVVRVRAVNDEPQQEPVGLEMVRD